MADRCYGWCCREIHNQPGPDQLAAAAEAARKGESVYVYGGEGFWMLQDAIKLHSMLINPRQEVPGKWVYACRHLLPSGDCDDYANRPYMCSAFPYGRPCPYPQCEFDDARHGKVDGDLK